MVYEQCIGATDEWYTPAHVFKALGCMFDMDVASPSYAVTPWIPARHFICADSLDKEWRGFVWMNAPFGGRNGLIPWLDKFIEHANGICLVPDRTSAPWWQDWAPKMDLILFVSPKLKFISADGKPGDSPAQGTCLGAMDLFGVTALHQARINGLGTLMRPVA